MTELRLDWCSHKAAKHAVLRWHYSRKMPAAKLVRIGVWEDQRFVGAILYGTGANRHLARPFGLDVTEGCELVRVALAPGRDHPTSRCLAISLRMLQRQSPGLKIVVSYADTKEGHLGTIYQATNWIFLGAATQPYLKVRGKIEHPRSLYDRYGPKGQSVPWLRQHVDPRAERVKMPAKLKYVWPFDKQLRRELEAVAKPFPKRAGSLSARGEIPSGRRRVFSASSASRNPRNIPDIPPVSLLDLAKNPSPSARKEFHHGLTGSDAPVIQAGEGGATPTSALHSRAGNSENAAPDDQPGEGSSSLPSAVRNQAVD